MKEGHFQPDDSDAFPGCAVRLLETPHPLCSNDNHEREESAGREVTKGVPRSILYLFGILSGFAAILYQVLWLRWLGLIFGSTSIAVGTTLAAFMGGMGIGGYFFGKIADRTRRPQILYGLIEFGIAITAIVSPSILSQTAAPYQWIYDAAGQQFDRLTAFRFIFSFLLLLLPASLMGGTFPVAVRYLMQGSKSSRPISSFYAFNTLGSTLAAFAMPLLLLPKLGLIQTLHVGAACNLIAALGAFFLRKAGTTDRPESGPPLHAPAGGQSADPAGLSRFRRGSLVFAFFLSGLCALSLETLWNRLFAMNFGSSIYTYSFILGLFLLGLVIGGELYSALCGKVRADRFFCLAQLIVTLYVAATFSLIDRQVHVQMHFLDRLGVSFEGFHTANILAGSLWVLVPAIGFGAGYPAGIAAMIESDRVVGARTGWMSAINAIGTTIGSLGTTFMLIPRIGSYQTFLVVIACLALSAVVLMISDPTMRTRWALAGLTTAILAVLLIPAPRWDIRYFHSLLAKDTRNVMALWRNGLFEKRNDLLEVIRYEEGVDANVCLLRIHEPDRPFISLLINGKSDASSNDADMFTQTMAAHLPMQFQRRPQTALIIGLGSGVTAAEIARYPVKRIDVAEISREVCEVARDEFAAFNRFVLQDPRVRLIVDDGRSVLSLQSDSYDLIVSEPSNPWLTGVSNLFTEDFFKIAKSRLNPGGMLCQWLHTYNLSWENIRTVLAALTRVFPYVYLFNYDDLVGGNDLFLLASPDALKVPFERIQSLDPRLVEGVGHLGIRTPNDVWGGFFMGPEECRLETGDDPPNSDRHPILELRAPMDLFKLTQADNLKIFHKEYPEITLAWKRDPQADLPIPGISAGPEISSYHIRDEGLRVLNYQASESSEPSRHCFSYSRWTTNDQQKQIELMTPLSGSSLGSQSLQSYMLQYFTRTLAPWNNSAGALFGQSASWMLATSSDGVRVFLAWNCPFRQRNYFLRYWDQSVIHVPVDQWPAIEASTRQLFSCR